METVNRFDPDVPDASDGRRNNGYPMQGPRLDEYDLDEWCKIHGRCTPTVPALIGPPTERPASTSRWPTLEAIGLDEALDALERVAAWAQTGKHPGPKWASQSVEHQEAKMLRHIAAWKLGETADSDTGEHPLAHAAARALMLLGLKLRDL